VYIEIEYQEIVKRYEKSYLPLFDIKDLQNRCHSMSFGSDSIYSLILSQQNNGAELLNNLARH